MERDVGVIARCVFDSGGLSGSLSRQELVARPFLRHAPYDEYQARIRVIERAFVPEHAASLAELALRFVLSLPGVSTATLGMPTVALVDPASSAANNGPLPASVVDTLRREHVWSKNFYEKLL